MDFQLWPARSLAALSELAPGLTWVMCGARGETRNRLVEALPGARFIGFEPDAQAWERLRRNPPRGHTYHNVAVGGREAKRTLYVTREPGCSSLLKPNAAFFGQFLDCARQIEVTAERQVEIVSLDGFLPAAGVSHVDFLELDTQGSELEILRGAERFLGGGVAGLKIEVEFAPIYQDQPLFSDVDACLRGFGFMLFDLTRNRYRRRSVPRGRATRGQLLWADALYLRDYRRFPAAAGTQPLLKLCLLSACLGFHDYAVEAMDFLLGENSTMLDPGARATLAGARRRYLDDLKKKSAWRRLTRPATTRFTWVD